MERKRKDTPGPSQTAGRRRTTTTTSYDDSPDASLLGGAGASGTEGRREVAPPPQLQPTGSMAIGIDLNEPPAEEQQNQMNVSSPVLSSVRDSGSAQTTGATAAAAATSVNDPASGTATATTVLDYQQAFVGDPAQHSLSQQSFIGDAPQHPLFQPTYVVVVPQHPQECVGDAAQHPLSQQAFVGDAAQHPTSQLELAVNAPQMHASPSSSPDQLAGQMEQHGVAPGPPYVIDPAYEDLGVGEFRDFTCPACHINPATVVANPWNHECLCGECRARARDEQSVVCPHCLS